MSQRLPSLFNTTIKSSLRTGAQKKYAARSYATHQEQDAKSPSSSTPLIVAGLLAVGGYVYYSKNKGAGGKKEPDPSDATGQAIQKKADQEIKGDGRSPSTIQNENKQLSGHPVATKKDAYIDPSTEKSLSGLKEGAQDQWDKAKQEADRAVESLEDGAQEAKDKAMKSADSVMDSVQQTAADAKNKVQATWNQVSTTASDRADETQQAVSSGKDQAKDAYNEAEQKVREKAGDIKNSLSK